MSGIVGLIALLALMLGILNIGMSGMVYGTIFGNDGLLKVEFLGSTGPTGPPGGGTGGGATSLASLTDVSLHNPVSGNSLVYTGTVWTNRTLTVPVATLRMIGDTTTVQYNPVIGLEWFSPMGMTGTSVTRIDNNTNLLPSQQWVTASSPTGLQWGGLPQTFMATYTVSASSSAHADIFVFGLAVNTNSTVVTGTITFLDFAGNNVQTSGSCTSAISLNQGDIVTVVCQNNQSRPSGQILIGQCGISLVGSTPI
jgi:hypothetical protein